MRHISIVIVVIALQGCSVFLSEDNDDNAATDPGNGANNGAEVGVDAGADDTGADDTGADAGVCTGTCPAPQPTCDGTAAVLTYSSGFAVPGDDCQCTFTVTRSACDDDGSQCEDGACTDPCAGIECVPPPPYCSTGTYIVFEETSCSVEDGAADCDHEDTRVDCVAPQVCVAGASGGCKTPCSEDGDCGDGEVCDPVGEPRYCVSVDSLCDDVVCPRETCADSTTQLMHAAVGTCESGLCVYEDPAPAMATCPEGGQCSDGVCVVQCGGEPCYPDERCATEDAEGQPIDETCEDIACGDGDNPTDPCGDSRSVCIDGPTEEDGDLCRFACDVTNEGRDCPEATKEGTTVTCDPESGYCRYGE
jgi:hypothetical protein